MRIRLTLLAALGAAVLAVTAAAAPRPSTYVLPGNAVFPEGIAFDQQSGNFYVGSTGDGSILRGHVSEPTASPFVPGIHWSAMIRASCSPSVRIRSHSSIASCGDK